MHAVARDGYETAVDVRHAVEHVLAAARKRRRAEAEHLLDLDRGRELPPLRVVADAAHLLVEQAAQVRNARAALTRRDKEGRRNRKGRRVRRTELELRVQLL